jgi:hypothetical protein
MCSAAEVTAKDTSNTAEEVFTTGVSSVFDVSFVVVVVVVVVVVAFVVSVTGWGSPLLGNGDLADASALVIAWTNAMRAEAAEIYACTIFCSVPLSATG